MGSTWRAETLLLCMGWGGRNRRGACYYSMCPIRQYVIVWCDSPSDSQSLILRRLTFALIMAAKYIIIPYCQITSILKLSNYSLHFQFGVMTSEGCSYRQSWTILLAQPWTPWQQMFDESQPDVNAGLDVLSFLGLVLYHPWYKLGPHHQFCSFSACLQALAPTKFWLLPWRHQKRPQAI